MPDFGERLPELVAKAASIAGHRCRGCASYHGLWPALRLSGAIAGIEADRPGLLPLLRQVGPAGAGSRWLIAGAADTGVLATVAVGLGGACGDVRVTVVDRCPTPLALCRDYADSHGLEVETAEAELLSFTPAHPQDLIIGHSILRHVAPDERVSLLRRLRSWLTPGGRLVLATSLAGGDGPRRNASRVAGIAAVLAACREAGVAEPVVAQIEGWLPEWHERRLVRDVPSLTSSEVPALCREAGFVSVEWTDHPSPGGGPLSFRRSRQILSAVASA